MFPTFVYSYLTLRNGGIALAQAHIASLIIFVSQCVNLCIVYLTSTKYAKISCSIIKKRPNCFSEGSSICATTLFATPSAMLRSAGQPISSLSSSRQTYPGTSSTQSSLSSPSSPPPPTSADGGKKKLIFFLDLTIQGGRSWTLQQPTSFQGISPLP